MAGRNRDRYRNSTNKLCYAKANLKDNDLDELPIERDGSYPWVEVDFSVNQLSSEGLHKVLEICRRCEGLRVLKLFKNQIDDAGAGGIAELFRTCPCIEEIHLSHNHFTAKGVDILVTAAEQSKQANEGKCLWIRLEQNDVQEPDKMLYEMHQRLSICERRDEKNCTPRVCKFRKKVHLPLFHIQRSGSAWGRGRGGDGHDRREGMTWNEHQDRREAGGGPWKRERDDGCDRREDEEEDEDRRQRRVVLTARNDVGPQDDTPCDTLALREDRHYALSPAKVRHWTPSPPRNGHRHARHPADRMLDRSPMATRVTRATHHGRRAAQSSRSPPLTRKRRTIPEQPGSAPLRAQERRGRLDRGRLLPDQQLRRETRVRKRSPLDMSPERRPAKRRMASRSPRAQHPEDRVHRDGFRRRRRVAEEEAPQRYAKRTNAEAGRPQRIDGTPRRHAAPAYREEATAAPRMRVHGKGRRAAAARAAAVSPPTRVASAGSASPSPGSSSASESPAPQDMVQAVGVGVAGGSTGKGEVVAKIGQGKGGGAPVGSPQSGSSSASGAPVADPVVAPSAQGRRDDEVSLSPSSSPSPLRQAAAGANEADAGSPSPSASDCESRSLEPARPPLAIADGREQPQSSNGVSVADAASGADGNGAPPPAQKEVKERMETLKERLAQKWKGSQAAK